MTNQKSCHTAESRHLSIGLSLSPPLAMAVDPSRGASKTLVVETASETFRRVPVLEHACPRLGQWRIDWRRQRAHEGDAPQ